MKSFELTLYYSSSMMKGIPIEMAERDLLVRVVSLLVSVASI